MERYLNYKVPDSAQHMSPGPSRLPPEVGEDKGGGAFGYLNPFASIILDRGREGRKRTKDPTRMRTCRTRMMTIQTKMKTIQTRMKTIRTKMMTIQTRIGTKRKIRTRIGTKKTMRRSFKAVTTMTRMRSGMMKRNTNFAVLKDRSLSFLPWL